MGRGSFSTGKRQREADKARKKRDKAERRAQRRERGPSPHTTTTVEEITGNLPTIADAMAAIQEQAQTPRQPTAMPCRLFVGGLSWDTDDKTLTEIFSEFGPVSDSLIVSDRATGRSRGFGFVTMENRKDAARAIEELHDTEVDGRSIIVNVATDRHR